MLYKKYRLAHTLDDAIALLSQEPGAVPIAGGTDLMVQLEAKSKKVDLLVDITRIPELNGIHLEGDVVSIGGAVTYQEMIDSELLKRCAPLMVDASHQVGAAQIQHMGTIGGNIANASPAGDILPPLYALDARVRLASPAGMRELPLSEFIKGVRKTTLKPGELISQVRFKALQPNDGSSFIKFGLRQSLAISVVSIACCLKIKDGRINRSAVALGSVAPVVVRSKTAENLLTGQEPSHELFEQAGDAAREDASPIDDIRGSAAFRRYLINPLVQRALRLAWGRVNGRQGENN
jgi:CO/xanthine dehydrogenase FAD-binding subunit